MIRRIPTCVAALVLAQVAAAEGSEALPSPLPLEWVLERAAASNPSLAGERAASDAAAARVGPAGSFEDPRFGYEASNIPVGAWDFSSTPLSGHQLGLRQHIPVPGLLSGRADVAEADARAAVLGVSDRHIRVRAAVERAWAELGFAQRAVAITARNLDLLRQLTKIAEAKYQVGTGLQQDVLRAQVELTALLQEGLRREADVLGAEANLAALLDLAIDGRLPHTAELDDPASVPALEPLLGGLEQRSPQLRALASRVEGATRAVRVAELEGYPDFDLGVGYRIRRDVPGDTVNGDDFVSAGFTVRLPVDRGKWRARVAEARAELRRLEAMRRGAHAGLGAQVRSLHAALVRADAEGRLIRTGLIPLARQSLESSRSGYEVGRMDFPSLVDSQVRLLGAELRAVRALADRRAAFAALEAAAGETLR